MYLEKINEPQDIKGFSAEQRKALAQEMRAAMLKRASVHGGHFGPDFGIVEAIIALHTVFDSPKDKFVFDISHQAYPHKMLTGRKDAYLYADHYNDVSGYTNPEESEHDMFNIGHTSTSISLATGLAKARDLKGD
uniref:1-deoxy-D-xylulose-5-phosphate synthase N-terminal domain-containing protein n=1 Tax=Selenomonas sp. TaxID=2053611 RepID=UPI0025E770F7